MRHKFMFALQKNVNSPIRSSIAKIWLKFIENPLVNAIFFQRSFSRWAKKRAFVARHTKPNVEQRDQSFLDEISKRKIISNENYLFPLSISISNF